MRELILLCAAAALAVPLPVQANPPGRVTAAEAQEFCRAAEAADAPNRFPYGDCISYLLAGDVGYLTQYCRYLQSTGELDEMGLTLSDCVGYFHK